MSGANFSRVKNWTPEILTNTDLNAEIDNILNNLDPSGVGDYSDTVAMMRIQTSPGALGSESQATSLAGELERLRYVIKRLIGSSVTYWYENGPSTISDLVAALGTGLAANRIVSGRTTGNSSQLCALIPGGTTASLTLSASVTPFSYYINGTSYSITANRTITLAVASSTAATAMVNFIDPVVPLPNLGQSKGMGMYNTIFGIISASGTLATYTGQLCGFKITAGIGGSAEYCVGHLLSTSAITNMWRGSFFDSSANHVPSMDLSGGLSTPSIVNIMKLAWIFANTGTSLAVTYNNPTISAAQPTSPNTGDYWFDLTSTAWKTFDSTTWAQANATLIGMSMQDTANCVAARTFDSFIATSDLHNMNLTKASSSVIQAQNIFSSVSIFGKANDFQVSRPTWSSVTNIDSVTTLSPSSTYFIYMKENGTPLVSHRYPIFRRDLKGFYHAGETWRALGLVDTDSSTAFVAGVKTLLPSADPTVLILDSNFYGTAGYTSWLSNTAQMTDVQGARYIAGQFSHNWVSAAATYVDVGTLALSPGVWSLSGQAFASVLAGTPANTYVQFGFGTAANNTSTGIVNGLSQTTVIYANNITIPSTNITVSNATGAITSIGTFTGRGMIDTLGNAGVSAVVPRFLMRAGISGGLTQYVKLSLTVTGLGTMQINGSFLAERLDAVVGVP